MHTSPAVNLAFDVPLELTMKERGTNTSGESTRVPRRGVPQAETQSDPASDGRAGETPDTPSIGAAVGTDSVRSWRFAM